MPGRNSASVGTLPTGELEEGCPEERGHGSWVLGGSLGVSWTLKKYKDLVCQTLGNSFSAPGPGFLLHKSEGCAGHGAWRRG